jgi:restriction system protein
VVNLIPFFAVEKELAFQEMRAFLGALRTGDSSLYVSTGGFTKDATQAAEHSPVSVTLPDRDAFIQMLLEHYEVLDQEYKAQVPLRSVGADGMISERPSL